MKTKLIIGLSVAAVVIIGAGIFIRFQIKSGEYREKIRNLELLLSGTQSEIEILQKQRRESEKLLLDAKEKEARLIAREKIFEQKIKVDSTILKEIETKNNEIDSLSDYYDLSDWNCYIANQISEDCNN